ncbi:putative Zinc finger HIT domain-containing protein 3 [Cardiosporidium cionae]|uniref:Zinc finger HIT domain-containing protein 3 n=1 Tax=Cardiosporidium cionae TaxID=476202 RepID=A0ABQ7JEQ1_9APIC|nr:putative Zinc finger HIT domain-containing protein 3 [Cardiosporidium cionae]|eukprot:KAF8822375.1 putative Zinc finger HIT domain-containing protein 3 [Cardiosporidium cionae]
MDDSIIKVRPVGSPYKSASADEDKNRIHPTGHAYQRVRVHRCKRRAISSGSTEAQKELIICTTCSSKPSKYSFKCCRDRFCSVECYKQHSCHFEQKPVGSADAIESEHSRIRFSSIECDLTTASDLNHSNTQLPHCKDDEVPTTDGTAFTENEAANELLTDEQKAKLNANDVLKAYLGDPNLVSVITRITSSRKPIHDLSLYLDDQFFLNFVDEIMTTISVDEDSINRN